MRNFEELHPDIANNANYKHYKRYTYYDDNNNLIECFENKDSKWIDVTEREQTRIAIAKLAEELSKLNEKCMEEQEDVIEIT